MWMSLARRSSALKIVVSTSLMTGAISVSVAVSLSIESVSSCSPSSATTSSVKPSVTSSRTRCDCSVFFSSSAICDSVATFTRSFLFSSRVSSSIRFRFRGSDIAMSSVPFTAFIGTKLYRNIKSTGIDRNRSWSIDAFAQIHELAPVPRRDRPRLLRLFRQCPASGLCLSSPCFPNGSCPPTRRSAGTTKSTQTPRTIPITIMMAGSTSESVAVIFVFTSSSKNSAIEFSIAGSAPVDSPTSIMSVASPGKHPRRLQRRRERLPFPHALARCSPPPASAAACSTNRPPSPSPAPAGCRPSAASPECATTAPPGT